MNLLPAVVTAESPLAVQVKGATTSTAVQRTDGGTYEIGDDVLTAIVDGRLTILGLWVAV